MTKPNSLNCIKNLPNGYYYFGLGCISDKPFMSYRMDLQAFGYLLWSLSLSIDSYHRFNWQMKAFTYYDNNKITSEFYDLENIQNIENTLIMPNYSAVGCAISHRKCWKYIIDNNINDCIIVEDDIEITDEKLFDIDMNYLSHKINNTPTPLFISFNQLIK
jgi:hypothetical protein